VKRYCVLLVGGALLAAVAVCVGQAPAPPVAQPRRPARPSEDVDRLSLPPSPAPNAPQGAAPAREQSVEELLARLDSIKAQQEELEKARTETVALVKEKLKQQKQRLQKLGVEEESAPPPPVSTTGGLGALLGAGAGNSFVAPAEAPARNSEKKP
jgi:hypothetical protein